MPSTLPSERLCRPSNPQPQGLDSNDVRTVRAVHWQSASGNENQKEETMRPRCKPTCDTSDRYLAPDPRRRDGTVCYCQQCGHVFHRLPAVANSDDRAERKVNAIQAELVVSPFIVVIDSREQSPFSFTGLAADANRDHRRLVVRTKVMGLKTGDYSIRGLEDHISIERKSLGDAYGTFGGGRERFVRELERLQAMDFAAVVIEADWPAIISAEREDPRIGRSFSPKMFYRSVISWQQKFPKVHWWPCRTRAFAERTTYRMLETFWRHWAGPRGPES